MQKKNAADLIIKQTAVFMGFNDNNSTNDIRLPVTAVMKYSSLNHIWGHFVLVDIESYRDCLGYFSAKSKGDTLSKEQASLLSADNSGLDALFSDADLMVKNTGAAARPAKLTFAPTEKPKIVDVDEGAYNIVFLRLKKGVDRDKAIKEMNKALKAAGVGAHVVTWETAAGMIGSLTILIKTALFVFVMILFFVAIIIIVNTLSMAALERTSEIGMMRAVGARKGFISRMFFAETAMLSFVFGGAGIVVGALAVKITALFKITSDNDMVQLLFGGDTFHPLLTGTDVFLSLFQLILVTLIAVIYPLRVARNITPLDAISRD
jgi:ABC-type antimicrobial peptide transport system permease subunit